MIDELERWLKYEPDGPQGMGFDRDWGPTDRNNLREIIRPLLAEFLETLSKCTACDGCKFDIQHVLNVLRAS